MADNPFRLLLVMPKALNESIEDAACQLNQNKSTFIRESVQRRVENLQNLKDAESTRGCLVSQKLGNVWRRAKRSALCQFLLNLAIIGLGMYIYTFVPMRHF
jgi:hypothetical protein